MIVLEKVRVILKYFDLILTDIVGIEAIPLLSFSQARLKLSFVVDKM